MSTSRCANCSRSARIARSFDVQKLLGLPAIAKPYIGRAGHILDHLYGAPLAGFDTSGHDGAVFNAQISTHFPAILDLAEIPCDRGAREDHELRGHSQADGGFKQRGGRDRFSLVNV